ncbi:MAG: M56 family metallopeptidase [Flavonifractor plautii]
MALLWAAGALACALCFLLPHLRGRREWNALCRWRTPLSPPGWTAIPSAERYGCAAPTGWTAPSLRSAPPVILLPKTLDRSDVSRLAFVLTHEMAHIRRFDALSKLLLAAAACLHWFNPLVWVMLVLANRDLELSCDAAVVRLYGAEARAPMPAPCWSWRPGGPLPPLCSAFNKNALEERIGAIMRSRKTSAAALAVALVLVVALTAVLATNAPGKGRSPPPPA